MLPEILTVSETCSLYTTACINCVQLQICVNTFISYVLVYIHIHTHAHQCTHICIYGEGNKGENAIIKSVTALVIILIWFCISKTIIITLLGPDENNTHSALFLTNLKDYFFPPIYGFSYFGGNFS